jgi:shikimate dehydrogenase
MSQQRAGVIGHPLAHSLSPAIIQAAFDALGIDARYEAWPTPPEQLEERIAGLRADDVLGANVTIPHKEAVVPLLDELEERAERIGAVNTIANQGGRLVGHNTDVSGFARALREDAGFDPAGRRVLILGAGGAARAVALALIEAGAALIEVAGRTPSRAERLANDLRPLTRSGVTVTWSYWMDGTFLRVLAEADLIVNCTPLGARGTEGEGQSPVPGELLRKDAVVFDLVYNPEETPLVQAARAQGAKAVSGLGMLVYQAADAVRIWCGQEPPIDRMRAAGQAALAAEPSA